LGVALAGITLVAGSGWSSGVAFGTVALGGDALVLASSLCIAGYYVFSAETAARLGVPVVAAWTSVFGAAVLLAPMGWELTRRPMHPSVIGVAAVLYLGVLTTALGVLVWFHALRTLPVRIASASQYLQPLIGVAASAAWFGDPLGPWFLGGTALVLGGIALTAYGRRR
jgi:drug/metabolite transporter (DMT)-like permease